MARIQVPCDPTLASLQDVKDHLAISGNASDTQLSGLVAAASEEFEKACGRHLLRATYAAAIYRVAPVMDSIVLREWPVDPEFSMTVIEGTTALTTSDYRLEGSSEKEPSRLVRLSGGVRARWNGHDVTVTYRAGYDQAPAYIREAVVEMSAHRWNQSRRSTRAQLGLDSKSPVEGSPESYIQELPYWTAAIERYRRRFV